MASWITRVTAAASSGTVLEWYDFFRYGAAAALVVEQGIVHEVGPQLGLTSPA